MERYIIKLNYPLDRSGQAMEKTAIACIRITPETQAVYDAIGWFEDNLFPRLKRQLSGHRVKKRVRLRSVVNIHNRDGLRSIRQITRMIKAVNKGRDTLARSGMPNVKLFKTRNKKLFLFDGHHSMLAYMAAGRKHLDTIPHLMVEHVNNGRRDDSDIFSFFGGLLANIKGSNWFGYAVNWQAPKAVQLCPRLEKNMGELFDRVRYSNRLYLK